MPSVCSNSGEIIGSGGTAVQFAGGTNTFTLGAGYAIGGDVIGAGDDVFQLGGTGSASFDLGSIGASGQYRDFNAFNVVGAEWGVSGSGANWNVESGASLLLASGGLLLDTTILNGGTLEVLSGAIADPTTVSAGALEIVSGGGTDDGAQILGVQEVYGYASGATVSAGGTEVVEAGGTASGTVAGNGGTLVVDLGGDAIGIGRERRTLQISAARSSAA